MVALIFLPVAVLVGWISGILINYLADVLPEKRRITQPFCSYCDTPFGIRNYLFWPRQCRKCGKYRKARTWLVEIVFIGISTYLWINPPVRLGILLSLVLLIYFGLVTIIDLEHRLVMHVVSLAGAILSLGIGAWLHGVRATLLGGLAGFGSMLLLYVLGLVFIKLSARWRKQDISVNEALGFGDLNLSGVIGLLVGWPGIIGVLVLGILLAGLVSFLYLLAMLVTGKYHPGQALPYAPFLIAGTIALLFYKEIIFP